MAPTTTILFTCGFLLMLVLVEHLIRRWAVPSVAWMLLLGLGYGLAQRAGLGWMPDVSLSPELVTFGFLPLLIFSSSRRLHVRVLLSELPEIGFLSLGGSFVSMVLLALPLVWLGSMRWMDALLFGVALSATDPLAIGAILPRMNAPHKLLALIEGESLLNDAVVLILFSAFAAAVLGHSPLNPSRTAGGFVYALVGGAGLGIAVGGLGGLLLRRWRELHHRFIGAAFPLIAVYGAFAVAHTGLRVSGVIAVVAATLTFSSLHTHHRDKTDEQRRSDAFFEDFWSFLAILANAMLFFGMGVMVGQHPWALPWFLVPAVVAGLLVSRALTVYSLAGAGRVVKRSLPSEWLHLLTATGLRGGLSVALLLTLPSAYAHRIAMVCMAYVLIFFGLAAYVLADKLWLRNLPFEVADTQEQRPRETR